MLRSLKELKRYTVTATDGDVGTVVNFLFDDERWAIRYLVVHTGGFFDGQYVLISPISFREVDWAAHAFHLALTKDKIKNAPSIDTDRPVSRQHERDYYQYYGYPQYWGYMEPWGMGNYPALLAAGPGSRSPNEQAAEDSGDAHLRSAKEVRGYHIQGRDDGVGFVEDFIIDDETWEVRYLVVDTSHWWWGHRVLVAPRWTSEVSWTHRKVFVSLSREAIKKSPSWDPSSVIRRDYEARLHDFHGLRGYWGEAISEGGPQVLAGAHTR